MAFDKQAFEALADEFGGLAGWYVKDKQGGKWTQDGWDDVMLRLYEHRAGLDNVKDQRRRGLVALQAFSTDPRADMLARIEARYREEEARRASAPAPTDVVTEFDQVKKSIEEQR